MSGLLTNKSKSRELLQQFYSPNIVIRNSLEEFENLYAFIARVNSWDNENAPPTPTNTDQYFKEIHKNMIAIKKVNSNSISAVIERVDWQTGTFYSQYDQSIDMTELDVNGKLTHKFYVRNQYDQIFKCLWNGTSSTNTTGVPSTEQPLIDFGVDSDSDIIVTPDGYKWRYLYTLDYADKINFFDDDWMPVPIRDHRKNLTDNTIGAGEISVINVYTSGNNFVDDIGLNITSTISIVGDGEGATAAAVIANGAVSDIVVTTSGNNYTYATAILTANPSYTGTGAVLTVGISPIGGHGYDLLSELGCHVVMITAEYNATENGALPTDIDFRQVGLLANPMVRLNGTSSYANSYLYNLSTGIMVSPGVDIYSQDEIVYQGASLATATFFGTVLHFDTNTNVLFLINTVGEINKNEIIKGQTTNAVRLVINNTIDEYVKYSGEIIYVENRAKIQRSPSGLEQFRLAIKY